MSAPAVVSPETFLQLVGEPQRWQLLACLAESDLKVSELVEATGRAQNVVSYHLGELRSAGLVASRRSAADGRDSYYRVDLDRMGRLMGAAVATLDPSQRVEGAPPPSWEGRGGRPPRVLFLCTGNSARSQMAEALAVHRSGGAVEAESAGSHPKPLHPHAVRAMAERGIDIAGNRPTHLDEVADGAFDRVVTLCDKVKEICPELLGAHRRAHWSMPDPAADGPPEDTYPAFAAAADDIDRRVVRLLAHLAHEPEEEPRARR